MFLFKCKGVSMEKRTVILLLLFPLLVMVLFFWLDFNSYTKPYKTIPCEKNGIIFSITTFDGDTETEPFVKCLGHTWLSIDNQSGHSVYMKDYEIKNDEILTFSIWAITDHRGVVFNLEPNFILKFDRYVGRQSLSVNINESQLKTIEDYIDRNNKWHLGKNCSFWAIQLWNELVDDEFKLKTQALVYTPKRLQKSLREFDCVEIDKDFSRSKEIFFYQDGLKMELQLCL